MISKKTFTFGLFILVFILIAATVQKSSSGAPPSHTGAPEDKTCATAGCHDDQVLNQGTAEIDLSVGDNVKSLKSGETYLIKFKITDKDVTRFGFQLLALTEKTNENCGQFIIIDSLRTQIVQNRYALKERQYVTYTFNGTDAISAGRGEWTVKWQAPSDLNGQVTFYYGAVSANDDMSDKGDKTYTGSLTLKNIKL